MPRLFVPEEEITLDTRYMHVYGPSTYIENGSITSLVFVGIVSKEVKLQWLVLAPFLLSGLTSGEGTGTVALLCVEGEKNGGREGGKELGRKGKKEGTSMGDQYLVSSVSNLKITCSNCRDADRCSWSTKVTLRWSG